MAKRRSSGPVRKKGRGLLSGQTMFQLPLLKPDITWTAKRIEDLPDLRRLSNSSVIGYDVESYDPNLLTKGPGGARRDGKIVGVSLSTAEFGSFYVPLRHGDGTTADGNVEDPEKAISWLQYQMAGEQPKAGANILYDMEMSAVEGIWLKGRKHDVQLAEAMLDEFKPSYKLDILAKEYLGRGKEEALLRDAADAYGVDPKSGLWRLPAGYVGPYAESDADLPRLILEKQLPKIYADGVQGAYDLECELLDALLAIRLEGVLVDLRRAEFVRDKLFAQEVELQRHLNHETGLNVDVWSGVSLAQAFRLENIDFKTTDLGNPSFDGEWLEAHPHPLPQLVAKIRQLNKARSAFIDNTVFDHVYRINEAEGTGYIHAVWKQTRDDDGGVKHGRFACQKPNLQQIPSPDDKADPLTDLGTLIRSIYIAEKGAVFGKCDYSAQEPRMQDHYSITCRVKGWEMVQDAYDNNPDLDRHQWVADLMGMPDFRKIAKVLNLSISYGATKKSVSHQLSTTEDKAQGYIDRYYAGCPFVKGIQDLTKKYAEDRGWIQLMGGRKCRFNEWEPKYKKGGYFNGEWVSPLPYEAAKEKWPGVKIVRSFTHTALNRLIQGSCSYQTKRAMIEAHKAGIVTQLPVHDELSGSRKDEDECRTLAQIMVDVVQLKVPTVVDVKIGKNWGELG